jgi:type III secretion protein U
VARAGEPTFEPSARRLAEARRRGEVAFSRALTSAAAVAAAFLALALAGGALGARLVAYMRGALGAAVAPGGAGPAAAVGPAGGELARLLAVPLGAAALAALVVALLQTRGLVTLAPLRPGAGWRRPAGPLLGEAGKGLLGVLAVGAIAFAVLRPAAGALGNLAGAPPRQVLVALAVLARRLAGAAALGSLGLGALDFLVVWRRHRRALRMTRAEVERELKETEGDPAHRAERRRLARELRQEPGKTEVKMVRDE